MVATQLEFYEPKAPLVMIVGNYGSGKTEVAVNVAIGLGSYNKRISIADLDIVNPYFRCREARALMDSHNIRVVIPPGAQQYADLPIVLPEIKGMLRPRDEEISIFDIGGDEVGAIPLSSFVEALGDQDYSLLQVINARRPFTDTVEGCLKMKEAIEGTSRLQVTGLISNTHLIEETTPEVIVQGYELTKEVSRRTGVPVEFVTAMGDLATSPEVCAVNVPILKLKRIMLPPWLRTEQKQDSPREETSKIPAGRTKPIFRP
ncbi:MAG: cobalamin biosynthesis protein CbiA [Deltaproteobacteria bacterium]|nr:cobalamin biosynthesis protein CbiA [Deltaproteobacteria bacterium]